MQRYQLLAPKEIRRRALVYTFGSEKPTSKPSSNPTIQFPHNQAPLPKRNPNLGRAVPPTLLTIADEVIE